jgi:fermentation-respiration switch protein FrsA (DUF1100 family)
LVFLIAAALFLSGCTGVFLQPDKKLYPWIDRVKPNAEVVRFPSADGTELVGVLFPADPRPAKGTVVHFHGNAQNLTAHFAYAYWLTRAGYQVFVFDYRGYGGSKGRKSIRGAIEDGAAALRYIREHPKVDPERIVVFAQSLGGAIAVASLAENPALRPRALVIEASFSDYARMAQDKLGRFFLTWPLQWPLSRALFETRWDPHEHIGKLEGLPLLVVHGNQDDIVPIAEGRALFDAAKEPKTFWEVAGGRHTEAFTRFGAGFRPRLQEWLEKRLGS